MVNMIKANTNTKLNIELCTIKKLTMLFSKIAVTL